MIKLYIILPLLALAGFGYVYHDFALKAEARAVAKEQAQRSKDALRLADEAAAREKSIQDALKQQAKRKQEREEREAAKKARDEARQLAIDARDTARRETEKLSRRIEVLKKDTSAEETTRNALLAERKGYAAEAAFLKESAAKVAENNKSLQTVLDNIAAAEAAIAARKAAEAAEAAAKRKAKD